MKSTHKHYTKLVILFNILFLLVLLEIFSYVYIRCCSKIALPSSSDFVEGLEPDWLERFYETTYDRELGWRPRPNASGQQKNSAGQSWQWATDKYGARRNQKFPASLRPYIATFGDSFTFGDEVGDNETWQYFLSNILNAGVANYGVGGYGTDQAYLRFNKKIRQGLTPKIAVLSIYEDNYKRVLNRFRPFFNPETGFKLGFKPRADVDRFGKLRFLETPLKVPVYDRQKLLEIVEASREGDFWASFLPRSEFPFFLNLLRAAQIGLCNGNPSIPTCKSATQPTWNSLEVQTIMDFKTVLNRFRPFFNPETGFKLGFKPRADVDRFGKLRFLETPLKVPVYDRQKLLEIVEASREGDFWASFLPRSEFPFFLNLLRAAQIGLCNGNPSIPTCKSATQPTWNSLEVQTIMDAIIFEFVRICESKNIAPVILFVSLHKSPPYSMFVKKLREKNFAKDISVIDFSESPSFDASKIRVSPIAATHFSPYGNKLLAEYIAQQLSAAKPN